MSDIDKTRRIGVLKGFLQESDYKICRIFEGSATWDDYPNIRAKRQAWRDEINELEEENDGET